VVEPDIGGVVSVVEPVIGGVFSVVELGIIVVSVVELDNVGVVTGVVTAVLVDVAEVIGCEDVSCDTMLVILASDTMVTVFVVTSVQRTVGVLTLVLVILATFGKVFVWPKETSPVVVDVC